MTRLVIEFVISFASTVGFGIITNIPRRALPVAGLTGALAWTAYCVWAMFNENLFFANLLAAIIIGVLGNVFAVVKRVPVNMIYIPSLVSLVPGGTIYLAMKNFANGQMAAGQQGVINTFSVAVALAVGFVFAEVIARQVKRLIVSRETN